MTLESMGSLEDFGFLVGKRGKIGARVKNGAFPTYLMCI
jgi:hypothetical protein